MSNSDVSQKIVTVRGEIRPEDLGTVAMSEHILYGLPGWEDDPEIVFKRAEAVDSILLSLQEFRRAGGKTIVDSGGLLLGRDAELFVNLSSSVGIHIIASTGLGEQDTIPGHFLVPQTERTKRIAGQEGISDKATILDANYLADLLYDELSEGMVVSGMRRTKIKAGMARAGASWDGITRVEELSIRGAAIAAKRAGASVRINGINQARRQLEIMISEGLQPDRIVVGHCDDRRAIDLKRDQEFAKNGAYIAYDHIGWEDASISFSIPDERRVELVKAMVSAGFADHIVLSCNTIAYAIDIAQPGHSFSHLLNSFVPKLQKAGIGDSAISTILHENPRRILTRK